LSWEWKSEGVMDDESGELWKELNWYDCVGRWRDRHEAVGEKQGVDSRDEVRHSGKTDHLFIKMMMKADGKE